MVVRLRPVDDGRARRADRGGPGCGRTAATSAAATPSPIPGAQDITVDVALDQLPEPDAVRTQAQFLRRWGIDELVDEGRRAWPAGRGARPRGAGMRSRAAEAEALLDPSGLGGFGVVQWIAPFS